MNDAELIQSLQIYDITIAHALNATVNNRGITVEFKQGIHTPADDKGHYCGLVQHRFGVRNLEDAIPEILRRAKAYRDLEASLAEHE